jgi:hypothetical protein
MGQRRRHKPPERVSIGPAEISVGDETAPACKSHQAQRTEAGYRDRARCFCVGAQLLVIGRKQPSAIMHADHRARPDAHATTGFRLALAGPAGRQAHAPACESAFC